MCRFSGSSVKRKSAGAFFFSNLCSHKCGIVCTRFHASNYGFYVMEENNHVNYFFYVLFFNYTHVGTPNEDFNLFSTQEIFWLENALQFQWQKLLRQSSTIVEVAGKLRELATFPANFAKVSVILAKT